MTIPEFILVLVGIMVFIIPINALGKEWDIMKKSNAVKGLFILGIAAYFGVVGFGLVSLMLS